MTVAATGVGGMQRHTHDLAAGLARHGHDVEVISIGRAGDLPAIDEAGVRWHLLDVPNTYGTSPIRHPAWPRAATQHFLAVHSVRPFDVVHSESAGARGLVTAGLHRRVPVVVNIHGTYLALVKQSLRRVAIFRNGRGVVREAKYLAFLTAAYLSGGGPWWARPCDVIVPTHQQRRDTTRDHFLHPERVHVVPNGVDTTLWRPGPRHTGDRPLVVAGGRLDRNKAFDVVIRALRDVDAELVLTGEGDEHDALARLAATMGIADRVRFAGALPLQDLAALVASCDAYVFPTLEYEASGLVLLEAMSAGVPVVAADQGATAEAIDRPGVNGVLVPSGRADALRDALRSLLADAGSRERIGAAARKRILEENTIDLMVERCLAVYETARSRLRSAA